MTQAAAALAKRREPSRIKSRCERFFLLRSLYGRPTPPPDASLLGCWISHKAADKLARSLGFQTYRHVEGLSDAFLASEQCLMRIEVTPSGWIHFVFLRKDRWLTVIDMPVLSWDGGKMKIAREEASLTYRFEGSDLVVNDISLHRRKRRKK